MKFPAGTSSKADRARSKAPLQTCRHALFFFAKIQVKVSRGWCMFGGCLQEDAETCASDVRLFEVICNVGEVMVRCGVI